MTVVDNAVSSCRCRQSRFVSFVTPLVVLWVGLLVALYGFGQRVPIVLRDIDRDGICCIVVLIEQVEESIVDVV